MKIPESNNLQNEPNSDDNEVSKSNPFPGLGKALAEHGHKLVPQSIKTIDTALTAYLKWCFYKTGGDKVLISNATNQIVTQNHIDKLLESLSTIDSDDVIQSPKEISVPIMEQLSYTDDEHLSDLLVQLLTASASKKHCKLAHPSMINVARNISPDEALLLKQFDPDSPDNRVPMLDIRYVDKSKESSGNYILLAQYYSSLADDSSLQHSDNMEFYVGNLISLGLFTYDQSYILGPDISNRKKRSVAYKDLELKAEKLYPLLDESLNISDWHFSPEERVLELTKKGEKLVTLLRKAEILKSNHVN